MSSGDQVRASHILIKHQGSRRAASWRDQDGTKFIKNTTKETAINQLKALKEDILSGKSKFEDIAMEQSDCSSAKRGGDLVVLSVIALRYGGQLPFDVVDYYPFKSPCTQTTWITIRGKLNNNSIDPQHLKLVVGDVCVRLHLVEEHKYRAIAVPHYPTSVPLFVTLNGITPISDVYTFDYLPSPEDDARICQEEVIYLEKRLASLLGSDPYQLRVGNRRPEIVLRIALKKWLKEMKMGGSDSCGTLDADGQGVIHLCARLGYTWAIMLFRRFSLSLDLEDSNGWTALHWASYLGWRGTALLLSNERANVFLETKKSINGVPAGSKAKDIAIDLDHLIIARELATAESWVSTIHLED